MEEAKRMLKEACQATPPSVPSWHALAKLEDRLENTDEARRLFQKTMKLDPSTPITHCELLITSSQTSSVLCSLTGRLYSHCPL